ncbi:MAG: hypothetical protein ABI775_08545 [Pseudonocardiales bacterium]
MSRTDAPRGAADDERSSRLGPEAGQELPAGSPLDSAEGAMGGLPKQLTLPLPRWLGPLAVCCAIGFIPWIVYLALTLPARQRAVDYDIAWVGYDAAMAVVMAALAFCALRRKPATGAVAAVAATMLVVDAWFDIVTTEEPEHLTLAIISAVLLEIPLAIVCAWVAFNAERVRARAYHSLHKRWESAIAAVPDPPGRSDQPVSDPPGPAPPR